MIRLLVLAFLIMFPFSVSAGLLGCDSEDRCDQGKAYSLCMQHAQTLVAGNFVTPVCKGVGMYRAMACITYPTLCVSDSYTWYSYYDSCSLRSYEHGWDRSPDGITAVCYEGCEYTVSMCIPDCDGAAYEGRATGGTCSEGDGSSPPTPAETDEDNNDDGGGESVIDPDPDDGSGDGGSSGSIGGGDGGSSGGGDGSGSGSGTGTGTGDGDGDGDGDGSGNVSGILTSEQIYEGKGKTAESVMSDFMSQVESIPVLKKVEQFFNITASASCPTWTLPASLWWRSMVMDYHCKEPMNSLLRAAGYLLLAAVLVLCVRIALT